MNRAAMAGSCMKVGSHGQTDPQSSPPSGNTRRGWLLGEGQRADSQPPTDKFATGWSGVNPARLATPSE